MTDGAYREEVLNVVLAQLLHERGVVSAPEQLLRRAAGGGKRRMPDVLVTFQGLRTAIEGKVSDQADPQGSALRAARERVEEGISHLAVALVYPADLRRVSFERLPDLLGEATLKMAVCSEAGDTGWVEGDLNDLAGVLRRTYSELVREDIVAKAAELLGEGVEGFAEAMLSAPGSVERAAEALGIREAGSGEKVREAEDEE